MRALLGGYGLTGRFSKLMLDACNLRVENGSSRAVSARRKRRQTRVYGVSPITCPEKNPASGPRIWDTFCFSAAVDRSTGNVPPTNLTAYRAYA